MNQDLGLKIIGEIMSWDDDRARREFQWLRLVARLKYDGYRDFQAGMRFIESLATWLQQFTSAERASVACPACQPEENNVEGRGDRATRQSTTKVVAA
ncbi:MAG: hypothetical protein EOQ56_35900 [Mesorhizobium sp.]|nr:MAG: hypothetical protein EOQ56_35900 [Mesorhizobium sp.]